ncbi:MAG: maleylpyruvate isomerase family mycothiol-dependent enzyme [Acidimicrobiales bacterium]
MEVAEHIDALQKQGELLAASAGDTDLDLAVPTCPEWRLRDLLDHMGRVHRWAASYVTTGRTTMLGEDEEKPIFGDPPHDNELVDWFRAGHANLCEALRSAPPDLECWTFMAAPSPLAFWARRQAHETTIHRVDAESIGSELTPVETRLAADGIDELLVGFAPRGRKLLFDSPSTMSVETSDSSDSWLVTLGTDEVKTSRVAGGTDDADCSVSGSASDLYMALWNRLPTSALTTRGDAGVLAGFCDKLHIRWS